MSIVRTHNATTHCDRYGCWHAFSYTTGEPIPDARLGEYAARNGWVVTSEGQHYCPEHKPEGGE